MAWLMRLRKNLSSEQSVEGLLSVKEIDAAEATIINHVQSQSYARELKQLANG